MRSTLFLLAVTLLGCGDDIGTGGSSSSSGGSGATGGSTSTGGSGGSTSSVGGSGGTIFDCAALPTSAVTPIEVLDTLSGSEDFAFDGKGNIAGKDGDKVVLVTPTTSTDLATLPGQAYGLRFGATGDLYVALPGAGKIVSITPAGVVSDYVVGLESPNGVYPDLDGNLWVTEFGGGRVVKIDAAKAKTTVAMGNSPNGVVLDPPRGLLFFTDYDAGKLLAVKSVGGVDPVEVGGVMGASFDGLAMDACGNVYAVDQGNDRLYRFDLTVEGALAKQPLLLAVFPQGVANVQFGRGAGFKATSIYAAGNPGVVFEVPVGATGADIPLPP